MDELISVIIPVYNTKDYLHKCIDSVIGQTYKHLQIIIVDDGSTDGSEKICDKYLSVDSRIQVYHKANGGLSSARNFGMRYAKGNYIGFVDSDDYIEKDMYETMISYMEEDVDIVACGRIVLYPMKSTKKGGTLYSLQYPKKLFADIAMEELLKSEILSFSACDKLFRKKIFEGLKFPYGKTSEDLPVIYEAFKRSRAVVHIGKAKYYNYRRENSISRREFCMKRLEFILFSRDILLDICKFKPELKAVAEARFVQNIYAILSEIENCKEGVKYRKVQKKLKKSIRKMFFQIWKNKYISDLQKKEIIKKAFYDKLL